MSPLDYDRKPSRRPEGIPPSPLPNILSTIKLLTGVANIYLVVSEKVSPNNPISYLVPLILIAAGAYIDSIDGNLAEKLDSVTELGAKLDILGDIFVISGFFSVAITLKEIV